MMKFWILLFSHLFAIAGGTVLGMLIDQDVVYKGKILFKQRGRGNTQNSEITVKTDKKAQRDKRKLIKEAAKREKKKAKAAKRSEKKL